MVNDEGRGRLPPYISYRTFWNFVYKLQEGIPARVDRSYWGETLSGSNGTHLMTTLYFLGLIDGSGVPTSRLRRLVSAKTEQRAEILREVTSEAFGSLLQKPFDLQAATYSQLEEVFRDTFGTTGDVSRKCIRFFVALASDAGVPLSPFIIKRFRAAGTGTGTKGVIKRTRTKGKRNLIVPQHLEEVPLRTSWVATRNSWGEMMLTKFPTFDVTWSDDIKLNWFKAFDELLRLGLTKGQE